MTPEEALARRAVACKGWRWMSGMITLEEIIPPAITLGWDEARIINSDPGEDARVCTVLGRVRDIHATALPDLTDPATLGCLLALVREAWGDKFLVAQEDYCHRALWCIRGRGAGMPDWLAVACMSEAEALVTALEAAPLTTKKEGEE